MLKVSFDSIGQSAVTFYNDPDNPVSPGNCAVLSKNATVAPATAGAKFFGVVLSAENDFAVVQTAGAVSLPCSGSAPAPGWIHLAPDGNGGVSVNDAGREFLVLSADSYSITFIL